MAAIDDPGTAPAVRGFPVSTGWPMAAKPCDSCKSSSAILYCKVDAAFLCMSCDGKIHGSNRMCLAHERVWMCEVCEQAPAAVTCKADAAALCISCDADIHSANPLARRHDRHPVVPFFEPAVAAARHHATAGLFPANPSSSSSSDGEAEVGAGREEAEAVSWLLPNSGSKLVEQTKPVEFFFSGIDPYLDLDYNSSVHVLRFGFQGSAAADSLVPVQTKSSTSSLQLLSPPSSDTMITACNYHGVDYHSPRACYGFSTTNPSISHSVSSSSLDVGVVPDGTDISFSGTGVGSYASEVVGAGHGNAVTAAQLTGMDREARVLRYREKRKNRKFEKTIRYASRKAYAETRPRIKGRFAKRMGLKVEADVDGRAYPSSSTAFMAADPSYGVVPSF